MCIFGRIVLRMMAVSLFSLIILVPIGYQYLRGRGPAWLHSGYDKWCIYDGGGKNAWVAHNDYTSLTMSAWLTGIILFAVGASLVIASFQEEKK